MVRKLGNLALVALVVIFLGAGYKLASTLLAYSVAGEYYEEAAGEYARPRLDVETTVASVELNGIRNKALKSDSAREMEDNHEESVDRNAGIEAPVEDAKSPNGTMTKASSTESVIHKPELSDATPMREFPEETIITDLTTLASDIVETIDTDALEKPRRETKEKPPISVDFKSLLRDNEDVVGWLFCEDTVINYPVVQTLDNDYYLHRMPDGSISSSGSIFMDASCDAFFADDNSIIYGHNMKNGSMFALLARYSAQDYFDEHPAMWLLTSGGDYKIELLAGFVTKADDKVYTINFAKEDEREVFVSMLSERSDFNGNIQPMEGDRFITLSTCNYSFNNARYVVVGILVPVIADEFEIHSQE